MAKERENFYTSTSLHLAAHTLASQGGRCVGPAVVQGGERLCVKSGYEQKCWETKLLHIPLRYHQHNPARLLCFSVPQRNWTNTLSSNLLHLHLFLSLHMHFFPTTPHLYSIFTLSSTSYFSSSKFLQFAAGITT